jgi:hypothetical protein
MVSWRLFGVFLYVLSMAAGLACNRTAKDVGKSDPGTNKPVIDKSNPDGNPVAIRFDGLYCSKVRPKVTKFAELKDGELVPQFFRFYNRSFT